MINRCYGCDRETEDNDLPYRCVCERWNQSERFKKAVRSAMDRDIRNIMLEKSPELKKILALDATVVMTREAILDGASESVKMSLFGPGDPELSKGTT